MWEPQNARFGHVPIVRSAPFSVPSPLLFLATTGRIMMLLLCESTQADLSALFANGFCEITSHV